PDVGSLMGAVERLGQEHGGGLVVAVTAAVDGTESGSLMPLGSQFSSKTVVLFADAGQGHSGQLPPTITPGTTLLLVDDLQRFPDAWSAHTASGEESPTRPNTAASTIADRHP
ncbi:MAG: hypothetical protein KTV68_09715, partial [Acidimicrobiia bacterium]|nr:hypothetical protein [Acidimicrobiia bacterium]